MRSRFFALLASILLAVCLISTLSGCGDTEKNNEAKLLTEKFIDAVIADDADSAYAAMTSELNRAEFDAFFVQIAEIFDGIKTYELTQTGWNASFNNGVSSYKATFDMKADNGAKFQVETTVVDGYENIYNIYFTPVKTSESSLPILLPFKLGALVLSVAAIGFAIWMIVDCAKRKIGKKALWIILILVGASVTLSIGGGLHINWQLGLAIATSSVSTSSGVTSFRLAVPLGALIYFCLRKRFTKTAEVQQGPAEIINVDETGATTEAPTQNDTQSTSEK